MDTAGHTPSHAALYTASHADASTRTERVYASLKRALLLGEHALGVRLGEERLARGLGVSRTPVREALFRLHSEGLVERHPEGGYCPVVPSIAAVRERYEVRIALEHAAMLRPRVTGRPHDRFALEALRSEWLAMRDDPPDPGPDFVLTDEAFHVGLASASGNSELVDTLQRINERIRSVRMRDYLTADRVIRTVAEHVGIVTAVIDGDIDAAVAAFDAHLRDSLEVVEQRVAGALMKMAVPR